MYVHSFFCFLYYLRMRYFKEEEDKEGWRRRERVRDGGKGGG